MSNFIITHLYQKELNLYGDTGNIAYLQIFLQYFGIKSTVVFVHKNDEIPKETSFIFAGGGPDSLQNDIYEDFLNRKTFLKQYIESGKPSLFICGSYQLLGKYYLTAENTKIKGIGIFDFYTRSPKDQKHRIVGNSSSILPEEFSSDFAFPRTLVGFQNHNGRTFFQSEKLTPLALEQSKKFGNNDLDYTEGILYKKTIGTYLHGPILVKNPHVCFFLLENYLKHLNYDIKDFYSEYIAHSNLILNS